MMRSCRRRESCRIDLKSNLAKWSLSQFIESKRWKRKFKTALISKTKGLLMKRMSGRLKMHKTKTSYERRWSKSSRTKLKKKKNESNEISETKRIASSNRPHRKEVMIRRSWR